MEELNGFKIDVFNQYEFPPKATTSTCPLCSEERKPSNKKQKCVKLYWDRGIGVCYHCDEVLQLHTYKGSKSANINNISYKRPSIQNSTNIPTNVLKWFEGRKISLRSLKAAKVSTSTEWMPQRNKEVNVINFNYFRDGELINIKYRDGNKNFKLFKDGELILSGIDRWKADKEVLICEGEMDELSFIEAGIYNVASVPNGGGNNLTWLDNCYEYFENKEKVFISVDNDEAGQKLQKELIRRLGAERCYLIDLGEYKDANDALMAESVEYLQAAYNNAVQVPLESVITYNDIQDELENFLLNGSKKGYTIGLDCFDEIFSTYTSQYIIMTGIPTHGKSDFVDQMCIGYNLLHGFKVAYASVENKPSYLHLEKIVRKFVGYKADTKEKIQSNVYQNIKKHINENFFFLDYNYFELDKTLDKFRELVKRKGVRVFVIDPFNKVSLKGVDRNNTNIYTAEYLNKIDEFCKEFDVLIILVAHPNKMSDKGLDKMPMPNFYDIKGGGEFYDMAYHGLVVYRDFETETVKVKVLKCKFSNLGINNAECVLMWNINNGRYSEVQGDEQTGYTPIWNNLPYLMPNNEEVKPIEDNNDCPF